MKPKSLATNPLVFAALFAAILFITNMINFSPLLGANEQSFTLFQFIGPTAAAFLGPLFGAAAIIFALGAKLLLSAQAITLFDLLRFLPALLATYYFAFYGKENYGWLIAALCMLLFWLNPVGQQAWFYPLYWLIPVAAYFSKGNLMLRSLGSTFTAHAVGSVVFLYTIPSTPALWWALIPVVAVERGIFSLGIASSYVALNSLLAVAQAKLHLKAFFTEPSYDVFHTQAKE